MTEISRVVNKKVEVDPAAHPFLRIAAVSYEGSLFGWNIEENAEQVELTSRLTFGFNVSIGTMKAIAVSESGKYLVVGGMDERIRIYDMHSNKAVGELSQHTGAITSLKFFKDSYLISASEDFNLCIWRVYDWQCVHILGGHKDTILDFSIHPTGKMAMSVSKDHTLKLWNLVQGRCAFTRRLKAPTEQVIWHEETGDYYLLVSHRDIQLFKAADNAIVATLTHGSRINRACFTSVTPVDGDVNSSYRMVTVCDNKTINMFDFSGKQTCCVDLSPLGAARPRDVFSSAPNVAAVKSPEMSEVVQRDSQVLTVATSLGQVIVLSVSALESLGVRTDTSGQAVSQEEEAEEGKEEDVELAVLSNHQIRAEPRLTALVSWNSAIAASVFANKGSKRPSHMLESETTTSSAHGEEVDTDDDSVDSSDVDEPVTKTKKVDKKAGDKKKAAPAGKDAKPSAMVKGKGEDSKKVKFDNNNSNDKKRKQESSDNHASKKAAVTTAPSAKNAKAKQTKPSQDSDDEGPAKVISFEDAYPSNDRASGGGNKGGKKQDNNKKNKNKNYAQRRSIHDQK